MDTPPPAIEIRDVHQRFRGRNETVHAVRGISLTIGRGEIVALLGPNGAGKTTLLDIVLGFTTPTQGSVSVLGQTPEAAVRGGHIAALLQTGGLLGDLTVRETVAMIATVQSHPIAVDDALRRAGADTFANRRVSKCSGGQQQRLRFALALLTDPDILILDEPTAGMDVSARREFWTTMREQASLGRTVIFATHYLEEAQDFAQRIVLVAQGQVIADAPVHEIQASIAVKTIRFTVAEDEAFALEPVLAGVRTASGDTVQARVEGIESGSAGVRHTVTTADADLVGRALFGDARVSDIDITPAGLEEAFVALTASDAADSTKEN